MNTKNNIKQERRSRNLKPGRKRLRSDGMAKRSKNSDPNMKSRRMDKRKKQMRITNAIRREHSCRRRELNRGRNDFKQIKVWDLQLIWACESSKVRKWNERKTERTGKRMRIVVTTHEEGVTRRRRKSTLKWLKNQSKGVLNRAYEGEEADRVRLGNWKHLEKTRKRTENKRSRRRKLKMEAEDKEEEKK